MLLMNFPLLMHWVHLSLIRTPMMRRLAALQYDEAIAAQLQATVEAERAHVQRSRDHTDQLSTTLASTLCLSSRIATKPPVQPFFKVPNDYLLSGPSAALQGHADQLSTTLASELQPSLAPPRNASQFATNHESNFSMCCIMHDSTFVRGAICREL